MWWSVFKTQIIFRIIKKVIADYTYIYNTGTCITWFPLSQKSVSLQILEKKLLQNYQHLMTHFTLNTINESSWMERRIWKTISKVEMKLADWILFQPDLILISASIASKYVKTRLIRTRNLILMLVNHATMLISKPLQVQGIDS